MTKPNNLDCHCETCPNWLLQYPGDGDKHAPCNKMPMNPMSPMSVYHETARSFGCIHHPNFTKLQAEVERIRKEIVALAIRASSCCVCAEIRELGEQLILEPSCEPTAK